MNVVSVVSILTLTALLQQDPRLTNLIDRLRDADHIEAREAAQQELRKLLSTAKKLRLEAARLASSESDAEAKTRLHTAVVRSFWIDSEPLAIRKGCEYELASMGSKVLLWGGGRFLPEKGSWEYFNEAWLLDPATAVWEKIEAPPIEWRRTFATVTVRGQLVIWGGRRRTSLKQTMVGPGGEQSPDDLHKEIPVLDGAVWDGRAWKKIAPCPIQDEGSCWTEDGLFVWGGSGNTSVFWDASLNSWKELPKAPEKKGLRPTCIAFGTRVLVWGGISGGSKGEEPKHYRDGAIVDTAKGQWSKIPDGGAFAPPRVIRAIANRLVVWDGTTGACYNPETNRWTEMSAAPLDRGWSLLAQSIGDTLYVLAGEWYGRHATRFLGGAGYDPVKNTWNKMADCPLEKDLNTQWTGHRLVVWGTGGGAFYDTRTEVWNRMDLAGVPTKAQPLVQVAHEDSILIWAREKENRGAVWREGRWTLLKDPCLFPVDTTVLTTWIAPRLIVWNPISGRAHILEPFD